MDKLHLRKHNIRRWRETTAVIRLGAAGAAAMLALPNALLAQTADISAAPNGLQASASQDCNDLLARRQIQMAVLQTSAMEPGAGPNSGAKAAAILGGAPSMLEQMRRAQASPFMPDRTDAKALLADLKEAPIGGCARSPEMLAPSSIMPGHDLPLPDSAILGTMSVAIKQTPFDRDWAAIKSSKHSRKLLLALAATGARRLSDQASQVGAVNRWVNQTIGFGEDRQIYGQADYWASAAETLRRGVGDCEDFAIAKMELLSALGISRDKMRLVVARDLVRNADHAVLVVTLAGGAVMLDNVTDRLLDARRPNDYRPIMSFSQNAKWVHGYAVSPAPAVRMASAKPLARELPAVLTVTREPEMPTLSIALLSAPLVLPSALSARV
jgi:predicted transglutaminase-like cysteine proteinase